MRTIIPRWFGTILLGQALLFMVAAIAGAGQGKLLAVDSNHIAIKGYDTVAYFTDRKTIVGREEFEYRFAGVVWRFGNESNRAAFAADPQIYMPRFGGYDPVGIARGVSTPGYPQLWVLVNDRLYLFYTAGARAAFIADPAAMIAAAESRWAEVLHDLAE